MPNKKMGRPTESPKTFRLQLRIDTKTLADLDECAKIDGTNRSEVVRKGIQLVKDQQAKK